jgi:hypothetical protein
VRVTRAATPSANVLRNSHRYDPTKRLLLLDSTERQTYLRASTSLPTLRSFAMVMQTTLLWLDSSSERGIYFLQKLSLHVKNKHRTICFQGIAYHITHHT